tara:strand:- start:62227 stop:63066 length:840 start_codon:yes stop_codon:yes gene_type:complete
MRHFSTLQKEIERRWPDAEIVLTTTDIPVMDLARVKGSQFEIVVACGGDGTVSQVAGGLVGSGAALGVVPIGSGNDFVKTLHLDKSIPQCLDILVEGTITEIDMIRFSGDKEGWCVNTIGMGLDGLANYYATQSTLLKGFLLYAVGALKAAISFRGAKMTLKIDGEKSMNDYLMITLCNGKWEGGQFYIAPDAVMDDGWLDLLIVEKLPLYLILSYLPRFKTGPKKSMRGIHSHRCKELELNSDQPIYVHADGEHISGAVQHLKLSVVEKALRVVVGNY